jgi:DNA-binding transcriptional MerR regulator
MTPDANAMGYSVKQLSRLAGVSVRTLHYYDSLGLRRPEAIGPRGYRSYGEAPLLRLQQILFCRELGLSLREIGEILDGPALDLVAPLEPHRVALRERAERLEILLATLDKTIRHLEGTQAMSNEELYEGFNEARQEECEQGIRETYGDVLLNESKRRWARHSQAEKAAMILHGHEFFDAVVQNMGLGPGSPEVQAQIAALHQSVGLFYDCTLEVLRGLGEMYATHPPFVATFRKRHTYLPQFLHRAVTVFVDARQTAGG